MANESEQPASKYHGPEDIYRQLVDESEDSWIFGLLAFAIVEEEKTEWMKHHVQHAGRSPTAEEIASWYQQQPPSVLLRAKGTAENALQLYSGDVLEEYNNENRKRVEEGLVVSEIRDLKRFWPQFGVNLAGGFISSVLFALLLIAIAVILFNDTSPVAIGQQMSNELEVTEHGEKP